MHLNTIRWWGCHISELQRFWYSIFTFTSIGGGSVPDCGYFVDSPALLLLSSHEVLSVFSAPDISSHMKQACVLYGDGSGLLALDILVLCLLCCFTACYKAKIPRMTWGHNSRNVIIQRRKAFSFLLIAPVMSPVVLLQPPGRCLIRLCRLAFCRCGYLPFGGFSIYCQKCKRKKKLCI